MFNQILKSNIQVSNFSENLENKIYLDTFSTRKLLIARNGIPSKNIKILIKNLINSRDRIINDYNLYLNEQNFDLLSQEELDQIKPISMIKSDTEFFKINELASIFDFKIHKGAIELYKEMGFIKTFIDYKTNLA